MQCVVLETSPKNVLLLAPAISRFIFVMGHTTTQRFWACYDKLPASVRALADKSYELLKIDPRHPSLHFKRVGRFWSVRVDDNYRALGVDAGDGIVWFWIGTHSESERVMRS